MLVTVVDASGASHTVAWTGQDQINDFSGSLDAGAVGDGAAPQQIAPANSLRAGLLFQNTSQNAMLLFEIGADIPPFLIMPGLFFPPYASYPIPTGLVAVQGNIGGAAPSVVGDTFTYREWQNASSE